MTRRAAQIPKFGSWDSNDQTSYTVVFDQARVGKGTIENNVTQPAPGLGPAPAPVPVPQQQRKASNDEVIISNSRHRRHASRGEESLNIRPPPQHHRRTSRDDCDPGSNGHHVRRASRGEDFSYNPHENRSLGGSPMHPQTYAGRGGRLGSASPAIDKKLDGGTPGTPTRNRQEKHVTTLPKFGDWDLSNPAAAEGFTVIFNKARDEKKTGGALRVPDSPLKPEPEIKKVQQPPLQQETNNNSTNWLCSCFNPRTKQ